MPLDITLFIASAIGLGLILSSIFVHIELNEKLKKHFPNADLFLRIMWSLALIFTILTSYLILGYVNGEETIKVFSLLEIKTNGVEVAKALAPLGIIIAALIASASVMKSIAENRKLKNEDHANEKSEFILENVISGLDTVYELLKDRNNDKVIWIEASRNLLTTMELRKQITKYEHQQILDIKMHEYRHKLSQIFSSKNPSIEPIDSKFFTGKRYWNLANPHGASKSFAETMQEIDSHADESRLAGDYGVVTSSEYTPLSQSSVKVIYDFLAFPQDYNDPLEQVSIYHLDIPLWKSKDIKHRKAPAAYFKYYQDKERRDSEPETD